MKLSPEREESGRATYVVRRAPGWWTVYERISEGTDERLIGNDFDTLGDAVAWLEHMTGAFDIEVRP